MRNLLTYENFLITEKNKAVEFFRNNPDLLSSYSKGLYPHPKTKWDPGRYQDKQAEYDAESRVRNQIRKRLEKLEDSDALIDPEQKNSWTVIEILTGGKPEYSDWWDWKYFKDSIIKSKTFDDFVKDSGEKGRSWGFPGEGYSNRKNLYQYGKFYKFMKNNYDLIRKTMLWIDKALSGIKGSTNASLEKDLMKLGISKRDVEVAMSYVEEWTSMSRKKLDPSVWPLLQKISVDPSSLPKVIYRGIFIDGAKISDETKFLKQWYSGSKPGKSQGKATSWSVDRGTAASFMTDQDFIKNKDKGYYVLLRWTVDPSKVIADLRNLPVDHKFWNQQEIIVSPDAKDYEVDTMIPGSGGYEAHKEFMDTIKGGQGAWGRSKTEYAMNFMNTPYDTLNPHQRMELKRISKMTVGEFQSEYSGVKFNPEWKEVPMPIWNYFDKYISNAEFVSFSNNKMEFKFRIRLEDLYYISDPTIRSVYKKYEEEKKFNQFAGKDLLLSDRGSIELIDDDYYDMDILIKMPTKLEIAKGEKKEGTPRDMDITSDEVLKSIFDEIGSSVLLEVINKTQIRTNVQRNINIQIQ